MIRAVYVLSMAVYGTCNIKATTKKTATRAHYLRDPAAIETMSTVEWEKVSKNARHCLSPLFERTAHRSTADD